MRTTSIWRATSLPSQLPSGPAEDSSVDVAVVGGGITGVTAAWLLAQEGRSVALLEAREIGAGDTGNSTGNLYETVSGGLAALRRTWDADVVRTVVESRREAVGLIERQARLIGAGAAFRRCPMFVYAGSADAHDQVDDEWDTAQQVIGHASLEEALPSGPPAPLGKVLMLQNQAQFHPAAYVRLLAAQAAQRGCRIFERSPVVEVDADKGLVRTAGAKVQARAVVLATHSPIGFHVMQAGMVPRREYALAAPLPARGFPAGIFWAKGEDRLSVRGADTSAGSFLICVGQEHKTGQHDEQAALDALEAAAGRRLAMEAVAFRWSAQNFQSPDGLPYIGKDASGAYVATGFATDGLVYGTLGAMIISDLIMNRPNRWADLYKATRFTPAKSARVFGEETASVLKAVVKDYVTDRSSERLGALAAGEAAIAEWEGERVAAYRDRDGHLFAVSPVCTHLKCMVRWNPVETSWDCPCHGSRFAPDGQVLEGPALAPLRRIAIAR